MDEYGEHRKGLFAHLCRQEGDVIFPEASEVIADPVRKCLQGIEGDTLLARKLMTKMGRRQWKRWPTDATDTVRNLGRWLCMVKVFVDL